MLRDFLFLLIIHIIHLFVLYYMLGLDIIYLHVYFEIKLY